MRDSDLNCRVIAIPHQDFEAFFKKSNIAQAIDGKEPEKLSPNAFNWYERVGYQEDGGPTQLLDWPMSVAKIGSSRDTKYDAIAVITPKTVVSSSLAHQLYDLAYPKPKTSEIVPARRSFFGQASDALFNIIVGPPARPTKPEPIKFEVASDFLKRMENIRQPQGLIYSASEYGLTYLILKDTGMKLTVFDNLYTDIKFEPNAKPSPATVVNALLRMFDFVGQFCEVKIPEPAPVAAQRAVGPRHFPHLA